MTAMIYTNDFNRLINATKNFCSTQFTTHHAHKYIKLEFKALDKKVTAIAVDGYRMAVEHSIVADCDADFTVFVKSNVKLPNKKYAKIDLKDDEVTIRCDDFVFGYSQPRADFFDWENAIPKEKPSLRIGFNGEYLLSALQAAKVSAGNSFRKPVVLEFRGEKQPIILRTNGEDIKMVLPLRITEKEG